MIIIIKYLRTCNIEKLLKENFTHSHKQVSCEVNTFGVAVHNEAVFPSLHYTKDPKPHPIANCLALARR